MLKNSDIPNIPPRMQNEHNCDHSCWKVMFCLQLLDKNKKYYHGFGFYSSHVNCYFIDWEGLKVLIFVSGVDWKYDGESSPGRHKSIWIRVERNSIILSFIRPLTSKKWVWDAPYVFRPQTKQQYSGSTLSLTTQPQTEHPAEIINYKRNGSGASWE